MRRRLLCGIVLALCAMGVQAKTVDEVKAIIRKVNTYWQTNNPAEVRSFWDNAAYHTGNMEVQSITNGKGQRSLILPSGSTKTMVKDKTTCSSEIGRFVSRRTSTFI